MSNMNREQALEALDKLQRVIGYLDTAAAAGEIGGYMFAIRQALTPIDLSSELKSLHQDQKLICGNYDYQCGFLDCLQKVKTLSATKYPHPFKTGEQA